MTSVTHTARTSPKEAGFTLIELSIVLVIIGLIVGGVLVGQDLIRAAEVRAQVSQIEKYNTAVNTFRGKFNAIPGDMSSTTAAQFGFTAGTGCDGTAAGKRDGNGLIDGNGATSTTTVTGQAIYEAGLFWQDLSSSVGGNLVDGSFSGITCGALGSAVTATGVGNYMPPSKMGRGMYSYAYNYSGYNWYGLSAVTAITTAGSLTSSSPLSVMGAYNIDKKMDDGQPVTGNVVAQYVSALTVAVPTNGAASATTCYDNSTPAVYTITQNNGAGGNCSLSFRFQ